jgi:hypothetical protein
MPKYFFNLAGDIPARDLLGHDCADDREDHGSFIAHRIGTEKPEMFEKTAAHRRNHRRGEAFLRELVRQFAVPFPGTPVMSISM